MEKVILGGAILMPTDFCSFKLKMMYEAQDRACLLYTSAGKVKKMIEDVPGVSGIFVEEVAGLPQIQVKYNHEKICLLYTSRCV